MVEAYEKLLLENGLIDFDAHHGVFLSVLMRSRKSVRFPNPLQTVSARVLNSMQMGPQVIEESESAKRKSSGSWP